MARHISLENIQSKCTLYIYIYIERERETEYSLVVMSYGKWTSILCLAFTQLFFGELGVAIV